VDPRRPAGENILAVELAKSLARRGESARVFPTFATGGKNTPAARLDRFAEHPLDETSDIKVKGKAKIGTFDDYTAGNKGNSRAFC
jgi:hypothetical protein